MLFQRALAALVLTVLTIAAPATVRADIFALSSGWTRVQGGEVTQWSAVPTGMSRRTRIDLVSYVANDGVRTTYYLIRRACPNGNIEFETVGAGNVLGVGTDCHGNVATTSLLRLILDHVEALPLEADMLLQ